MAEAEAERIVIVDGRWMPLFRRAGTPVQLT